MLLLRDINSFVNKTDRVYDLIFSFIISKGAKPTILVKSLTMKNNIHIPGE